MLKKGAPGIPARLFLWGSGYATHDMRLLDLRRITPTAGRTG